MVIKTNNIVIGATLEAVLFSYYNKYKLLYAKNTQPLPFDSIDDFGLGNNKKYIWDKYIYLLSMAGYIPFENKIKHIRYVDANSLVAISNKDGVYDINYEKLHVFDDSNFLDLPLSISSTSTQCRIVDFFSYTGKKIESENILRKEPFLNQIVFEENKKISTVSYSPKNEIENTPEHLVKIKLEAILKNKKITLDHMSRQVLDLGKNIYKNFDNVEFNYDDAPTIYNFYKKRSKIDYLKYLNLKMHL